MGECVCFGIWRLGLMELVPLHLPLCAGARAVC